MGIGKSGEMAIRLTASARAWRLAGFTENAALVDEAVDHLKDMEAAFNATCAYELGFKDGNKDSQALELLRRVDHTLTAHGQLHASTPLHDAIQLFLSEGWV